MKTTRTKLIPINLNKMAKRQRINRNTGVPVRTERDFLGKLKEIGFSNSESFNQLKMINCKVASKHLF